MIGALSAIGSIFSFLGAALKGLFTLIVFRQGEKAQAAKSEAATLEAVTRERDALTTADSAEEAARRHDF